MVVMTNDTAAPAGIVIIHAHTILLPTPHRTAESLLTAPTPIIPPEIACVVLAGIPAHARIAIMVADPVSAENPWYGLRLVIFMAIVFTILHPPKKVARLSAVAAMSLGTFFGGWRIVKTMAMKITNLRPYQGFSAETGSATIIAILAWAGIPASTTHAISGGIMGVGAVRRLSAVRWGVGKRIVWAWIITIPAGAAVSFVITTIINGFK